MRNPFLPVQVDHEQHRKTAGSFEPFASRMITLDLETFQQSQEDGNVTGVIYMELESRALPERGWSDFPVIILGWWVEALLQLEVPTRRNVLWQFMDGPHSLTLTKAERVVPNDALAFARVQSFLREAAEHVVSYASAVKCSARIWRRCV
jgi:hypothetical protein